MTTNEDVEVKVEAVFAAWAEEEVAVLEVADVGATMRTRAETTSSGVVVPVGQAVIDSVASVEAK